MDKEDAFTYYKLIRDEEKFWLDIHHKYSQQYLTLISAIFAISIGALYQLKNEPLLVLVIIAPSLLNISLCVTARKMCDQIYRFFLEGVAIQKKLVPLIGLDNQRKINLGKTNNFHPFSEDKHYLPERWLKVPEQKLSCDWITKEMYTGSNRYTRITFLLLFVMNIGLIIGIIIFSIIQLLS